MTDEQTSQGIDGIINEAFAPIADAASSIIFYSISLTEELKVPLILIWLVAVSIFLTLYFGFINLRCFKHSIDVLRGKYDDDDDDGDDGQINRFQALATSLSGTVGLGNIGGVAIAVSIGGSGAVFWMLVMGLIAMTTKFMEVALGVKYRHHRDVNNVQDISGGPMYYLRDAFGNRNIPYLGAFFAGLFAICCIGGSIGGGNMFQANQAFSQWVTVTGGEASAIADKGWLFGLVLAILTGIVIIGGIKSIANVASKIVPFMGLLYLACAVVIIGSNLPNVPEAIASIFIQAFAPNAVAGGIIGAIIVGVQRATFSNEAGVGTAAIAHSAAKTKDHISQGFVGMLGPFIDTIVICMITALVIVISGAHLQADSTSVEGVVLTSRAFETGASWFPYVLALIVTLFAFSTIITWSYYGVKSATFLFGENAYAEYGYKMVFLTCIIIGASAELGPVIAFTDAMIFAMAIPNVIGLYMLAPEIKRDLKKYFQSLKNSPEKA